MNAPTDPQILPSVERYYAERLARFGPTPRGVDWSSAESQALRFDHLLKIVEPSGSRPPARLLDVGCGYGALLPHLRAAGLTLGYVGYDISPSMVAAARVAHAADPDATFTDDPAQLEPVDYVVASGIFNVKLDHDDDAWRTYVDEVLARMRGWARRGLAFNMLSLYSDPERRRSDLHYEDPRARFDLCKRTFSPRVSLLHDYPLFEFTILVRM
jgi:SAM-dependent methyltransferase